MPISNEVGIEQSGALGGETIAVPARLPPGYSRPDYGFWLVVAVAMGLGYATWLTTPGWSGLTGWSKLTGWSALVGLPFLVYLMYLAWRVRRAVRRFANELGQDQASCRRWSEVPQAVQGLVDQIKEQRTRGLPTGGAILGGAGLILPRLPGRFAEVLQDEVYHGYLAGDLADPERLELLLRKSVEPFFANLDRYQTNAFMLGLLGTVTGILLTVLIAQVEGSDAVFRADFLNGIVVKAGTTVQGIVTALYIRHRAALLGDLTNARVADLTAVYRRSFLPKLGRENTDIEILAGRVADKLRSGLQGFLDTLADTLRTFLAEVPKAVETALASALADRLEKPLGLILNNMTTQVGQVRDAIKESETAIRRGVDHLEIQVDKLLGHPQQAGDKLQETVQQAFRMSGEFERIVPQLESIALALQTVGDQLPGRPSDQVAGERQARDDLAQLIQANQESLNQIGGAIRDLSALIGNLGAFAAGIGEQERQVEAVAGTLAAQRGTLEANQASLGHLNQGISGLGERIDRLGDWIDALRQRSAIEIPGPDVTPRRRFWHSFWPRARQE